jgi:hypothetical protein
LALATLRDTGGLDQTAQLKAVAGQLDSLDQIRENILGAVGEQSATLQNLSGLQGQIQDAQLQEQQNLLQATLATTARVLSQSLLDFIH